MKIKRYFGQLNMTWKKVILLAIFAAVITAAFNIIPVFKGTSFTDMAVNLDVWFLYAVIIVVNCKKITEASLKTFVFFLISQPLIYLMEVPFVAARWDIFVYYKYWLVVTLLTIPGAAICFLVKKQNWLSVMVISVATIYLSHMSVRYLHTALDNFPYHILSSVFCLALGIVFALVLFDERKKKLACLAIIVAALIVSGIIVFTAGRGGVAGYDLGEGSWTFAVDHSTVNDEVLDIEIDPSGHVTMTSKRNGAVIVVFKNEKGEEKALTVVVDGKNFSISEIN